jgi:hypothetical protein
MLLLTVNRSSEGYLESSSELPSEHGNERLRNRRRLHSTLNNFLVGYSLAIEGFVAGFIGLQGSAVQAEVPEYSFGATEKENLCVGSSCADLPFPQAAEASDPIVNRSESSFGRRSLSSEKITMSIFSPPTWIPRLPLSRSSRLEPTNHYRSGRK